MFKDSKIILYLKRNSLEVYRKKEDGPAFKLDFPPEIAQNEEIIDIEKFDKLLIDFFQRSIPEKSEMVIILSEELVFQKIISKTQDEKVEIQKFYDEIPFDTQKIAKKEFHEKDGLHLIATNKSLFEAIKNTLQKQNHQTEAIVPVTLFTLSQPQSFSKEDILKILANLDKTKDFDFTEDQTVSEKTHSNEEKENRPTAKDSDSNKKTQIILIIIFILLIGVLSGLIFIKKPNIFKTIPFLNQKKIINSVNLPSSEPSVSPSLEPQVELKNLKVQILNGTGKEDQALKAKSKLQELGFESIDTGNAQSQNSQQTQISFSKRVNQKIKDEVKKKLEETFKEVTVVENQPSKDYDVEVTTGQELTY